MTLDPRQTIVAGILVLFLGKYLNKRVEFLRQFNIPEPVTGGIIVSFLLWVLYLLFGLTVDFSNHYRQILLVVFFTSIGLGTEFKSIVKGGRLLFILTLIAIAYIFTQNFLGVLIAKLFDMNPNIGILAGSAALQGGHGNIVAWSPILEGKYGVENAMEVGMTVSTFGLIFGGILGGPVAKYLIQKYKLSPQTTEEITVGIKEGSHLTIDYDSILKVLFLLAVAIGIGIQLNKLTTAAGFTLPLFVTCMFGGMFLSNLIPFIVPKLTCPKHSPTLAITSDLSLGLFLAMAMMALRFWEIGFEVVFIIASMAVQVGAIVLFTIFVLFRILGKNYDSAVISAGYIGSALGATPTAMANMAAVTQRYGASPIAFVVMPIIAAFIIQLSNALVIEVILRLIN